VEDLGVLTLGSVDVVVSTEPVVLGAVLVFRRVEEAVDKISESGDGRSAGYVRTEVVSRVLVPVLLLIELARELASWDNLDFALGGPTVEVDLEERDTVAASSSGNP
jgi:hypothetical protein